MLCFQIRRSFCPGENTQKEANRIRYELAMRWTKWRYAFIVTMRTDKQRIHTLGFCDHRGATRRDYTEFNSLNI